MYVIVTIFGLEIPRAGDHVEELREMGCEHVACIEVVQCRVQSVTHLLFRKTGQLLNH
jgi:hypothetical protein